MAINAFSYFGNILGESSDIPTQRIILQLLFSAVLSTILESIYGLCGIKDKEEEKPATNPDAEGTIVIVFTGLGLTFNFVCLFAYWFYTRKDAALECEEMKSKLEWKG